MGLTVAMCVTPDAKRDFLHVVEETSKLCTRHNDWGMEIYPSPVTILDAITDYMGSWDSCVGLHIVVDTSKGTLETTLFKVRELQEKLELLRIQTEEDAIDELMLKHSMLDRIYDDEENNPFYEWPEPRYGGGE